MSDPVDASLRRLPRRARDPEQVMRAQAADLPLRVLLGEVWRRVLAWVDRWTSR